MKVVITGASGLLGGDIADVFENAGHEVLKMMGRRSVNVMDPLALRNFFTENKPDAVIHTAGYRDLDEIENHESEGFALNTYGTRCVTLAARAVGAKLLYISSDAVYDGEKASGYHEYDIPNPVNVYGKSKLLAEREIEALYDSYFIIRTALLFGDKGHRENNLIYNIIDKLRTGHSVYATTDQICCPSYTADLAKALIPVLESNHYGTYLIANTGTASRWDVTRAVADIAGLDTSLVKAITTEDMVNRKAKRAKNTVFASIAYSRTFGEELPDWSDALHRCMEKVIKKNW